MGRRKIEIQPITHERNRSVTFLKRKNGLFKKAYELGVLCSVDVAVIIFEERPGHHVKLYQYCSTDVHNIVQRHMRFDGEKDTRTPHDFSNNKAEEAADDDDDIEDDDNPRVKRDIKHSKVNGANGSSTRQQMGSELSSLDIDYRSSNARASPHSVGSNGSPTSIPMSGERHGSSAQSMSRGIPISNKRPRLAPISSDMADSHVQSVPSNLSATTTGSATYPYRLDVDLPYPASSHLGSMSNNLPPSHATAHPSLNGLYSQTGGLMNSTTNSQPFIPQGAFDFSRHQGATTLRAVTFPSHGSSQYSQQQQNMFPQHRSSQSAPMQSSNMFVELLNSSAEHGAHSQAQSQFPSFDWPVHNQQTTQPQQQQRHSAAPQPNENVNNWLDFLSGSSAASQAQGQQQASVPPHTRPASNSVSSTRSISSFAVPPPSSPESLSPTSIRRKRSRDDEMSANSVSRDMGDDDGTVRSVSVSSPSNSNGMVDSGGGPLPSNDESHS
ncbi:hypothetical protein C8Q75DRAFT_627117 [Abortiporus biennis]|nr:hypothetical protein C8Q75DRAFT_627117 [Abortiporus biennis]